MPRIGAVLGLAGLFLSGVVVGAALDDVLLSSARRERSEREAQRRWDCVARALTMEQRARVTIPQGLWGTVCLFEGDFMPGPPEAPARGRTLAVSRTIYVHALTHQSQVVPPAGADGRSSMLHSAVLTPRVDSTQSDERGFFQVRLPPGRYSLFVRERGQHYVNLFDGQGNVFPVTVDSGRVTYVRVDLWCCGM